MIPRTFTKLVLAAGLLTASAAYAQQQPAAAPPPPPPAYGPSVTIEQAKKAVAAALVEGKARPYLLVVAVVDPSGNLVYFERMDGALYASNDIAIGKARTAATFKRPSMTFFEQMEGGHNYVMTLSHDLVAAGGGLPLVADGKIIGAIGVSGSPSGALDQQAAQAGVGALK
jgi:glc operon protein GlcG